MDDILYLNVKGLMKDSTVLIASVEASESFLPIDLSKNKNKLIELVTEKNKNFKFSKTWVENNKNILIRVRKAGFEDAEYIIKGRVFADGGGSIRINQKRDDNIARSDTKKKNKKNI